MSGESDAKPTEATASLNYGMPTIAEILRDPSRSRTLRLRIVYRRSRWRLREATYPLRRKLIPPRNAQVRRLWLRSKLGLLTEHQARMAVTRMSFSALASATFADIYPKREGATSPNLVMAEICVHESLIRTMLAKHDPVEASRRFELEGQLAFRDDLMQWYADSRTCAAYVLMRPADACNEQPTYETETP